ncbi:MAG: glutathione S-transferase family protein [Hyphomonadaceae bacterium]|nr:glutathione S-transferase family protein [Hyphomonadaceae bacterium]
MTDVVVHGFQRSTYVNIVRLVLRHKGIDFRFNDLETQIGSPAHFALHPFGRVPILEHGDFRIYETSAIVLYIEDTFKNRPLMPSAPKDRARVHQWISAVNGYYYPYMIYHLVHERLVFPPLGIAPDEKVVQASIPQINRGLDILERSLEETGDHLVGALSLADFFLYPSIYALNLSPEGQEMLPRRPRVAGWLKRMDDLETVRAFRAATPTPVPIEHARAWVDGHRPRY